MEDVNLVLLVLTNSTRQIFHMVNIDVHNSLEMSK